MLHVNNEVEVLQGLETMLASGSCSSDKIGMLSGLAHSWPPAHTQSGSPRVGWFAGLVNLVWAGKGGGAVPSAAGGRIPARSLRVGSLAI